MSDALADFTKKGEFNKMTGAGLFLKFESGKSLKVRVLTTDPLVYMDKFGNTKFAFIVYNFTDGKAQIYQATPAIARQIGELHVDEDYGANIQKRDLKITPNGEGLERRYDIKVMDEAKTEKLTATQIKEAKEIDLEEKISKNNPMAQRMSFYDPKKFAEAKAQQEEDAAEELNNQEDKDVVIEDVDDEPINLDDIPF